ncbi:MAG: spermidine/putrescine ABC transporter substrate-binding protein [Chloroflexi bacterium]|nr:spermidine/putrescine ABC transporter substrate-binding protein [Chloroflexota bacterium]MBI3339291.1 spermidine/putrescine ABC transporter substrate-binding protein [Chloroflexota bacterium]
MKKSVFWKLLAVALLASFIVAACGGSTGNVPTATAVVSSGGNTPGPKVTSTGFVCPEPNPRMDVKSTELNLFVWTEYIPPDMQECFQLVYGIKVNRDEYSANEEMYAKLSAGGTAYDLVQPTDFIVSLMIRQGLLQELDKSKLPNISNYDPNYMNFSFDPGNKYTLPYQAGTDAIVYNADKVTTPPTSWADLWKPEYAGKMVFLDDSRATIGATLLTLGYDVNTKDPAQLDQAKAKLKQLVPGIKLFDSDSPKTALIAGDVDLGMTWTGEAFLAQKENPAIKYVYPTEGAILWQDNWAMPKDAPHADAAYAWLNYTMQGDIFWMMLRDFPYTNPNKAALDYAKVNEPDIYNAYINSPITNTPAEDIKAGHRIDDVGDALPLYDQIWTEVKGQ